MRLSLMYLNIIIKPAIAKYSERRPRMANAFDVKTMNGSCVTAKIAGIESTANTTSAKSTSSSVTNSGVAARAPSTIVKKRSPSSRSVTG